MKKTLLLSLAFILVRQITNSQNPVLWGMSTGGGANTYGAIFKVNGDGSGYSNVFSFDGLNGLGPRGGLMKATDGKLYGMTEQGGTTYYDGKGTIFKIDPTTYNQSAVKLLTLTTGFFPQGGLVQASNGKLYGMTYDGGVDSTDGVVFSFDPTNNTFTRIVDFNRSNGQAPRGNLLVASDGNLYGMTERGGAADVGVLFKIDPATDSFTKLLNFDNVGVINPYGSLIQATDGKLYGVSLGRIFRYNIATNTVNLLHYPLYKCYGGLIQANDGKFYGVTYEGGSYTFGTIFSYDLTNDSLRKMYEFKNALDGSSPNARLIQASNGKLYGTTTRGGLNGKGVVFSYDLVNDTMIVILQGDTCNMSAFNGDLFELTPSTGITPVIETQMSIYPNPATESVTISVEESLIGSALTISDVTGREVLHSAVQIQNPKFEIQNLSSGVYFVTVANEKGKMTKKLVKE